MEKDDLESARWFQLLGGLLTSQQHATQGVMWFFNVKAVNTKFDAIQKYN